jgi:hypothetical protein
MRWSSISPLGECDRAENPDISAATKSKRLILPYLMSASSFALSKWYMDCIDADGNAFIGYAAFIRWKDISFNYSNSLVYTGKIATATSLVGVTAPLLENGELTWRSRGLKAGGTWKIKGEAISEQLTKNEKGGINWNCIMPKAIAEVGTKKFLFKGLGYAEKLDMSMKPWDLQVHEIRWGRFVSGESSLVWIVWKGPVPLSFAYLNGERVEDVEVTDTNVMLPSRNTSVVFSETVTLREGPVISTAFAKLRWLRGLFPANILNTFECKWRSRAILRKGTETHTGWAIHESVKWH